MIDDSLRKLQVDYLDCMMIHWPGTPDGLTEHPMFKGRVPNEKDHTHEVRSRVWDALQDCLQAGKVRHIGVSNFTRQHLNQLMGHPRYVYCTENDI